MYKKKLKTIQWGKKHGVAGLVSEKTKALYAKLNKTVEAATSSYSATGELLGYIYFVLVAKNLLKIGSRCLSHEFSFTDFFFKFRFLMFWLLIAIIKWCALQLYHTSLSVFILLQLQGWVTLRVRAKFLLRNFHGKRLIM